MMREKLEALDRYNGIEKDPEGVYIMRDEALAILAAAPTEGRYITEWSDEDDVWIASGKYPSVKCHGDTPFDAMRELQLAEEESDAALRGEEEPPEPDPNADGPADALREDHL